MPWLQINSAKSVKDFFLRLGQGSVCVCVSECARVSTGTVYSGISKDTLVKLVLEPGAG